MMLFKNHALNIKEFAVTLKLVFKQRIFSFKGQIVAHVHSIKIGAIYLTNMDIKIKIKKSRSLYCWSFLLDLVKYRKTSCVSPQRS